MKVTKDKVEKSQAYLTVEVEPAEVEEGLARSYRQLVQRVNIPGFRKGKAPRAILERYIGKEGLLSEALEHIVPDAYEKALKEQSIEAVGQPQLEVTQMEPTVVFKATVPLMPSVKLGDYHSVRIAPEQVTVTDEQVNETIESLRHEHATWEPVEREVQYNDLVTLDIESKIGNAPYINQKGLQFHAAKDRTFPVTGFVDQVAGMKKGEEKEFNLTFPKDFARAEMAGKEATFKVKVGEIKKEVLPEINDDFAKQANAELATVDALRQRVRDNLKARAEERARAAYEDKVLAEVVKQAQVEFPPVLVEREIHRMLDEQASRFQMQGIDYGAYLKSLKKTDEQLHEELEPSATQRVTQSLVLGKVAEDAKVGVSDAEIDTEIEGVVKSATEKQDDLRKALNGEQSRESIRRMLLTRKTLKQLTDIAGSTPAEGTPANVETPTPAEEIEKKTTRKQKKEEEKNEQ